MVDNTEEALGIWGRVKEAVTRPLPDDYYEPNLGKANGFLSRNKDKTPASVEAASFMAEALPLVGDAIAAKEVWDEINKAEPNWALVGALGGATIVGLVPGAGDAAAKAIREGAKKGLDVVRRLEVDPNAVGSMGGNIRLRPEQTTTLSSSNPVLEADEIIFEWEKGNMTNPELRSRMREAGFPIQNKRISPNATGADIEVVGPSDELLTWDKVPVDFDPTTAGVKPQDRSPTPRFNEEALAAARKQSEGSREILVDMPIDDFLSAAKTGVDDSKLAGTRALVAEGTPFESVPSLSFKNNGDGTGQVTGHEGRHRALALKEQGDTTIPVRLTSQGGSGPEIRWGKQQDPDDFDYVDNIPTRLIEEGGSSVVPMPDSILNLRSTSPDKAGPTNLDAWSEGAYFKDPETGKPEKLYHGMGGSLRGDPVEFVGDNLEESYAGSLGPGTYLTRDPDIASSFAMNQRGSKTLDGKMGGQVFPVYSNITKVVDDEVLNSNRSLREKLADYIDSTDFEDGYPYEVAENLRSDNTVELKSLFTRMEDGEVRGSGMSGLVSSFLEEEGYEGISVVTDKGFHEAVIFPGHGGLKTPQQNIKSSLQGPEGLYSRDSNDMRYAQGGVVQQMDKMYKDGGLATDGMDVDPVSGNDIPVGSNAKDVRDDVDAKLSSGEYVVPADVVKYLGVAQLEKLVSKAKDGLEDMAENGRMGGEPVEDDMSDMEEEYTLGADLGNLDGYAAGGLVEGMDYEALIDRVKSAAMKDPSITNMLKAKGIFIQEPQPQGAAQQAAMETGAVPTQAAPPAIEGQAMPAAFAEGGMVYGEGAYTPTNYTSSYNPYEHTMGFSAESGVTGKAPGTPYQPEADVQPTCPEGYTWNPELKVCMPIENKATTSSSDRRDSSAPVAGPKANPNAWMDKYDYTNPETLFNQSMTTLDVSGEEEEEEKSTWLESLGGAAKGLLSGGLVGGLIGKFVNTNKAARMAANARTLRDMGRTDLADQLDAQYNTFVKEKGLELVHESFRDGDRIAARIKEVKGADWSTDATQRAASSGGGSSAAATPKSLVTRPKARPAPERKSASDRLSAVSSNASKTNTVKVASGAKKIADDAAKAGKTVVQQVQATKPKTTYKKNDSKSTGGPTKASQGSSKGMAKGGLVTPRKKK